MTTDKKQMGLAKVKPNWDFWGIIDPNGNYVLEPICHYIFNWAEGIACLEKVPSKIDIGNNWKNHYNGEYGFINAEGEMITDFSFGYAKSFYNGMAAVNKGKKWGFIDKKGEIIFPCEFDDVHHFNELGCIASLNNKWGLIDRSGKWKIENMFESISGFSFGLSVAAANGNSFIIDTSGNKIVDLPKEWNWFEPVSEKLILFGNANYYLGEYIYGFMDLHGRVKSKPHFCTSDGYFTARFTDGKLFVETLDGKSGFVNEEGEFQISNVTNVTNVTAEIETPQRPFDEVLKFSEGFAVARKGELWGVINERNEVVIDFIYKQRFVRSRGD